MYQCPDSCDPELTRKSKLATVAPHPATDLPVVILLQLPTHVEIFEKIKMSCYLGVSDVQALRGVDAPGHAGQPVQIVPRDIEL